MSLWNLTPLKEALNSQSLFGTIEGVDFITSETAPLFDFDYLSRSGNRAMKESYDAVFVDGVIPPSFMSTIGRLISLRYAAKWNALYRQCERMYSDTFNPLNSDDYTVSRSLSSNDTAETSSSALRKAVSALNESKTADESHSRSMTDTANKTGERTSDNSKTTDRQYDEVKAVNENEYKTSNQGISGTESTTSAESETGTKTLTKSGSVVDSGTSSTDSLEKVDGNTVTATERTGSDSLSMSDSVSGTTANNQTGYSFGFNSTNPVETDRGNTTHTATEDRDQAQRSENNFTEEGAENRSSSTDKSENKSDSHVQTYDNYSETETPNTQVAKSGTLTNDSTIQFTGDSARDSSETHTNKGSEAERESTSDSYSDTTGRNVDENATRRNTEGKARTGSENDETTASETALRKAALTESKTVTGYKGVDVPDRFERIYDLMGRFNLFDIVYNDIDEILTLNIFVA